MRKLLAFALVPFLFSAAGAQQQALDQLLGGVPAGYDGFLAPLPDRGGAVDFTLGWDGNSPFSYNQRPASAEPGKNGAFTIRNVRSGRTPADHKTYEWATLAVDPARLVKAIYSYKTFGTGHTFLTFTFEEGGAVNSRGESVGALTFGAEGWSREPKGYNITHALAHKYPLIWLATTFESYADHTVAYKGKEIFFHNIAIGPEQTRKLFALLLARVEETNRGETYDLLANSCTNNPVNLLNQVLPEDKRVRLEVAGLTNPKISIPKLAAKKLLKSGALLPQEHRLGPDNQASFDITKI